MAEHGSSNPTRPRPAWAATGLVAVLAAVAASGQPATSQPASGPTSQPAATAPATAAATQPDDADVARLIRQLGADEGTDRDAAQQQLVDRGTIAEDALTAAAARDPDPEVRARSAAALGQIRDHLAYGPTLLTIHDDSGDPAAVLKEIGRQAQVKLVGVWNGAVARPDQRLTLDVDRRPFWDVMTDVCRQLNVCPLSADPPNSSTMRLFPANNRNWLTGDSPHQVVGPFWVGVTALHRLSSVEWPGATTNDTFFARLMVCPEPKLVVTQISPLTVREATDDAGHSLLPPPAVAHLARPGWRAVPSAASRGPVRTVEAWLQYPADHPGRRIVTLAGDLNVTLAQGSQRFEAADVMTRPTVVQPLPGVAVRVSAVRSGPAYYQVTVECGRAGMADARWAAMTNRVSDLAVEDAAGRRLTPVQWTVDVGNSDQVFKATAVFSKNAPVNLLMNRMAAAGVPAAAPPQPGDPARVIWNVAARFKVVTVPVAFHDLPMP